MQSRSVVPDAVAAGSPGQRVAPRVRSSRMGDRAFEAEPLPVARILARASALATRPVAWAWLVTTTLGLIAVLWLIVMSTAGHRDDDRAFFLLVALVFVLLAIFGNAASGGLARVGWLEARGVRASWLDCGWAVGSRAGRVLLESLRIGVLGLLASVFFGVGTIGILAAYCTVVPSCTCERDLAAGEAADRGYLLLAGNQVRSFFMHLLATPFALGGMYLMYVAVPVIPGLAARLAIQFAMFFVLFAVYGFLAAATFLELRLARPTIEEVARAFE